jgi:crotonobetainyl-CoA:carnitine CoA-transferase CaiB-like acyl-CoA transferase
VLDLGQVVAGNFAGALLSYFGADVIKVRRGAP